MSRQGVVQEVGWEHQVISWIPELGVVLVVEHQHVSWSDESESGYDAASEQEIDEDAWIVQGTVLHTQESGEYWTHDGEGVEDLNPEVVDNSESSVKGVLTVLSWTHF